MNKKDLELKIVNLESKLAIAVYDCNRYMNERDTCNIVNDGQAELVIKLRLQKVNIDERLSIKTQECIQTNRTVKTLRETLSNVTNQLHRAKGYIDRRIEEEVPEGTTQKLELGTTSMTELVRKGPNFQDSMDWRP